MDRKLSEIKWLQYQDAERFLLSEFHRVVDRNAVLTELDRIFKRKTSTRLWDWVDHLIFPDTRTLRPKLEAYGFRKANAAVEKGHELYTHPGAILPGILISTTALPAPEKLGGVGIQVADLSVFLKVFNMTSEIEGSPISHYRRALFSQDNDLQIWAIERRGENGYVPREMANNFADRYLHWHQRWLNRERNFEDPEKGLAATSKLAGELVEELGVNLAAWIAFEAERVNWQLKNRAGQVQKQRQDVLGLGWANHDHHTFRSSRRTFPALIDLLQILGFELREKFYAGSQAGWGAQVLEQPVCRLVVFADVDLSPEELEMDFRNAQLTDREELGTVGLWCALHGESVLQAGLHHLACRFSFTELSADLEKEGIGFLPSFSNFSYLKQAFSEGESWAVADLRLEKLKKSGILKSNQANRFRKEGVIGSHLENIQRDNGFKGFNQESVSDIIRRTDPRMSDRNA